MPSNDSPDSDRRLALLWAAAAPLALLVGCSVAPAIGLQAPKLSFRDLTVRDANLQQVRFDLIVDAENPNAIDLPITGLRFTLELAGQAIAQGRSADTQVILPSRATRSVTLALVARNADLMAAIRRLPAAQGPGVPYRLSGYASWGQIPIEIPFERLGVIDPLRSLRRGPAGSPPAGA
jgi:LEA14-like dessication related protein